MRALPPQKKRFLGKGNRFFCGVFDFHGKSKGLPGVGLSPFLKKSSHGKFRGTKLTII